MKNRFLAFTEICVLIIALGCMKSGSISVEEQLFKRTVRRLDKMFRYYNRVPIEKENVEQAPTPFMINLEKRIDFVRKTQEEWKCLIDSFQHVIHYDSSSKWADDALFCICIEYLILNNYDGTGTFTQRAEESVKRIEESFSQGGIEEWTKNNMPNFWPNYARSFGGLLRKENEWNNIKYSLQLNVANSLISEGKYRRATDYLRQAVKKCPNTEFEDYTKEIIEITEKHLEQQK
ncbi:MAG: hypothetical protein AB1393_11085 [Candidatus Edwardsbacteria bacterium]